MRIISVCDSAGNILALMSMPDGGLRPSIPAQASGQVEVEIDVPDITDDMGDEDRHRRLHELATGHRVDVSRKAFVPRAG